MPASISRELLVELAGYMDSNVTVGNLTRWLYFNSLEIPSGWNEDMAGSLCQSHKNSLQFIYDFDNLLSPCQRCGRSSLRQQAVVLNPPEQAETTQMWCDTCTNLHAHSHRNRFCTHVPQNTTVQGYHSGSRAFLNKGVDFDDPGLLGLEIETYVSDDVARNVHNAINGLPILAEHDSSLSYENGVEFVFQPITLDKLTEDSFVGKWAKSLRGCSSKGFTAGPNYGMHINVNIGPWTKLHVGKFCHCMNSRDLRSLHERVAGRAENHYFRYNNGRIKDFKHETDKYLAAANRDNRRVEVRIFRSALNWDRIRRNCEYVDSFARFSKVVSMKDLNKENYFKFLNLPENKKRYQELRIFLGLYVPKKAAVLVEV